MIRDVEYGHAEYVLYKYQYAANRLILGMLISNLTVRIGPYYKVLPNIHYFESNRIFHNDVSVK